MLKCIVAVNVFVCVVALNYKLFENDIADNFTVEPYQVTTADSYILTVFRLRSLKKNIKKNRHSVLMFHGLLQSSDRFIEYGRNLSLAYDLADAGFDVWLGNNRGNKYSRQHVYLNPDDPIDKFKFFNYTYEEIGVYDVAATVDYILDETKTKRLHYIGHSQGGTVFFALNALRSNYNVKFLTANLLAGAGYQKYFTNPFLEVLSSLADQIYELLLEMGFVEIFPLPSRYYTIDDLVDNCLSESNFKNLCQILHSSEVLGTSGILVQPGSLFAGGGAVKALVAFGQNVRLKRFCRWDYGEKRNKEVYGTSDPPIFNLNLVTVNTTLHFGMGDVLVNFKDVSDMAKDMPNAKMRKVARPDFGHSDFINALDAKELVYDYIIEGLLHFEGNIKPDIIEKKTPFYISIMNTSNPITKNHSNSLASIKSDSPITLISPLPTSALYDPYPTKTDYLHSTVKKVLDLSDANVVDSLPRNVSNPFNTNMLHLLNTTFSNSLETNVLNSFTTNIHNSSQAIDQVSKSNVLDLLTTIIPVSSNTNVLDSLTKNITNSSQALNLNSSAIKNPDLLARNGLNLPKEIIRPEKTNTSVMDLFIRNNSESLSIPVPCTSTKNYINTTLLITIILTLKTI